MNYFDNEPKNNCSFSNILKNESSMRTLNSKKIPEQSDLVEKLIIRSENLVTDIS